MTTASIQEALSSARLEQLQKDNPFIHITDAVYEILEEAILSSRLDPGAKLRINTIADTLGVSGTPVREAMERLILRGLVVERIDPGRKYRSYTVFDIEDADIEQLFVARKSIDATAAYICAQKNWRVDIEKLEYHAARFQTAMTDYVNGRTSYPDAQADRQLHVELVNAAGNRYLSEMYRSIEKKLNYLAVRTCEFLALAQTRDDMRLLCNQHDAVINAIRMGFPQLAQTAMAEHVDFCEENCLNYRNIAKLRKQ